MRQLLLALLVLTAGVLPLRAADAPANPVANQPLEVTAQQLEADDRAHTVVFSGDVVASQGDVVIYAQKITVHYAEKNRQIETILAERDVRIVQGPKVATAQRAELDHLKGEIVLTGNPEVHQGKDTVTGEKITVFLNQDRSVVSSSGESRVNAVFHPQADKQP